MQIKHIGLTALVTLLTGISTPVSALTSKEYTPEVRQTQPELLVLSGNHLAQSQPDEFNQWIKQGNSLLDEENYPEALKAFEQAVGVNPNSVEAWEGRGLALYGLEQYSEAIAAYRKALELDRKSVTVWIELGNALDDAGKPKAALEAYDQALRLDSNSASAWYNRGVTLGRLKR
ncbi:MAG: tetratricopeptide repeat protein, partial [Cyanobacteriota bacterium]